MSEEIVEIPLSDLHIGDTNVRSNPGDITELADSIEEHGVRNPLIVRSNGNTPYEIIAGSRRCSAAKAVGLDTVPCIIREMDDEEALVESLTENLQRGDIPPDDEADAIARLYKILGTQQKVADAVGKSRRYVADQLEASKLIDKVRKHKKKEDVEGSTSIIKNYKDAERTHRTAKTVWEDDEAKQVAFYEETKDLSRDEVKEARETAKQHPRMKPKNIVKKVKERKTKSITLSSVSFPPRISAKIEKAADDRGLSHKNVVQIAVEEWLKQVGYDG